MGTGDATRDGATEALVERLQIGMVPDAGAVMPRRYRRFDHSRVADTTLLATPSSL